MHLSKLKKITYGKMFGASRRCFGVVPQFHRRHGLGSVEHNVDEIYLKISMLLHQNVRDVYI